MNDDAVLEQVTELVLRQWDKMTSYTNLVLVAGYAAFFATWTQAEPFLSEFWFVAAGLLASISVVIFITFEIAKVYLTSQALKKMSEAVVQNRAVFFQEMQNIEKVEAKQINFWVWSFWPTVVTGYAAGLIVIIGFLIHLAR